MDEDGSCQAKMGGNSLKGTDPNRPLMGERGRNDSPGNMSLRPSAFASKRAWDPGKWSSLPLARIWRIASHPSPKPGNYVDHCLWKISGFGPPISKKPASHKNQIKVRAQNRTYLYVRFWAYLMVLLPSNLFPSGIFFHLIFANSVQMGSDTRSPRFHRRRRTPNFKETSLSKNNQIKLSDDNLAAIFSPPVPFALKLATQIRASTDDDRPETPAIR